MAVYLMSHRVFFFMPKPFKQPEMTPVLLNLLGFVAFGTVCYLLAAYTAYFVRTKSLKKCQRALLVIAHPDDECMFFGPTLTRLASHSQVYVLCLSPGNFYEQGYKRKGELWESCRHLGIQEENIILLRHTKMSDDPEVIWNPELISRILLDYIHRLEIDTLLTFDKGGVSGHRNHSSIYYAVAFLSLHQQVPEYCSIYVLKSVNIFRKYSLHLDVPLSYMLSPFMYVATLQEQQRIQEAMHRHASQYVWFRQLYMKFSRYTVMNTWRKMSQESYDKIKS